MCILITNILFQLRKIFRWFTLVKDLAVRMLFCLHDKTAKNGKEKVFQEVHLVYVLLDGSFLLDVFDFQIFLQVRKE